MQEQPKHRRSSPVSAWPPDVSGCPRAPSLLIYRWPLNTLCSGAHRASGMAMSVGFAGVSLWSLANRADPRATGSQLLRFVRTAPAPALSAVKMCVGFPLLFHWASSIRYLLWDYGIVGFSPRATAVTSAALLGGCLAASSVLSALRFPLRPLRTERQTVDK